MSLLRNCLQIHYLFLPSKGRAILQHKSIFLLNNNIFSTCSTRYKKKIHLDSIGKSNVWIEQLHKQIPFEEEVPDLTNMELIMKGFEKLPGECKMLMEELYDISFLDHPHYNVGDLLKLFEFVKEDSTKLWRLSADSLYDVGFSKATFTNSSTNTAVFSGYLDTRVPDDGTTKKAGFCNINSPPRYKSFRRQVELKECGDFTHLVLRCRGDGRTYMLLLDLSQKLDISWGDQGMYHLHTRGGPHWQTTYIPFSYFIRMSRGAVQDRQHSINRRIIKAIGITAIGYEGNFRLELDYIGVYKDIAPPTYPYELYLNENVQN